MASTTGGGLFAPSRQVQEVACLLRGGQPARGTEVLSLRFKNGCVRPRNVFLLDGYVMTVTYYNKTDAEWDRPKIIPRFQPWRVGQLLSSYLVYVQPVTALICDELGDGPFGRQDRISDKNWARCSTDTLQSALAGDLSATISQRTTTKTRQVTSKSRKSQPRIRWKCRQAEDLQRAPDGTLSDLVEHLTQENIDTFRPLSQSWLRFLGLDSRRGDLRPNHQKRKGTAQP